MLDYGSVSLAGAELLRLVEDDQMRNKMDQFLMLAEPHVELALIHLLHEVVDEINSQVSEHYHIRLVHEDTTNFVEVTRCEGEYWQADAEERRAIVESLLPPEEEDRVMRCIYCNAEVTQEQLDHANAVKVAQSKYAHTDCIDDLSRHPDDAYHRSEDE